MDRSTQAPNDQNKSRIGQLPPLETEGTKPSNPLEGYYIVEGVNTERFYIRHLDKLNKLKYKIKNFKDDEQDDEKRWKIIDGIKCLGGGNYFSKLNSLEELRDGIDKSINQPRQYFICIFDLDKCMEDKEEGESFFQTYKTDLLLLSLNEYNIFCASMPNVEYWFLSHFDDSDVFDDNLSYNTENKDKIKDGIDSFFGGTFYSKSKSFCMSKRCNLLFNFLCEDNNLKRAIDRAMKKSTNPNRLDKVSDRKYCNVSYSDMYNLFK